MYDLGILESILLSEGYKTINYDENVLPPSNGIYSQISQDMLNRSSLMSKRHIYTHLKQNRCGTFSKILKFYGVTVSLEKEDDRNFELSDSNVNSTFLGTFNYLLHTRKR